MYAASLLRRRSFSSFSSSSPSSNLDLDTILHTLSLYSNDPKKALEFFEWTKSNSNSNSNTTNPEILARTVDILGKHFEFPTAIALIQNNQQKDPADLRPSFRSLFNRLAAAHLVNEAINAYNTETPKYGLENDQITFLMLVDALCDHRHAVEAEELCFGSKTREIRFPPNTKTYNLILRGWAKLRCWHKCRQFWEEMDVRGAEKDLHSYSIYMDAMCKSGKPWKAVKLYKEIRAKGFVLDVVAYNTVIQAVGMLNGVDFGIRMFREMVEYGVRPNVVTLNTIVKLLCREERFREGYAFVDEMRKYDCEPNAITYHCFFQNLCRPQEILGLFDRMVRSGCAPRMDTYVMLIKKFGRWGFLRPVFKVWKVMEDHGCSPDGFAYNTLIDALLQKGMVDMARKYDQEMVAKGLSAKPRKELGTGGIDKDVTDNVLSDVF